ncbi:MAG: T9SS type A sorting domain-containing protein [Schleiferiaceae bacterium]|jgi:hypothetical protein|nr:T9SS type A sorting domain-containing protein [Schleiferiaceae bacterium]
MKLKATLWAFCLFFSISQITNATHLIGGEITYECHPTTGQYRFNVKLYRECGIPLAANLPPTVILAANPSNLQIVCTMSSMYQATQTCYDPSSSVQCGVSPVGEGAVQVGVFQSPWTTINSIPTNGLNVFWGTCCRPANVTNLPSNASFGLRAYLYPSGNTGSMCNNNSPIFSEEPAILSCSGASSTFTQSVIDQENDSLFVSLDYAKQSTGANAVYATGYSAQSPFPSTMHNTQNIPLTVDPSTGNISFTSYTNGLYVAVYKVEEWRNGALLSETFRDAPTYIKSCTPSTGLCPQTTNNNPSLNLEVDSLLYPNGPFFTQVIGPNGLRYETTVKPGDTINAKLYSFDTDFNPNCTPQILSFSANGSQLSTDTAWGNPSLCGLNAPCATLTSLNASGMFVSPSSNNVEFQWAVQPVHLNYQGVLTGQQEYTFNVKVSDDACPIQGTSIAQLVIKVNDDIPGPPSLNKSCLSIVAATGDISFNINPANDTADSFDGYVVYHSTNKNGPYLALDTLTSHNVPGYTHVGQGAGPNHYFLRTLSSNYASPTSDTLALMNLVLTANPTSPSTVTLDWNAHSSNSNANTWYQIWRQTTVGGGFSLLDSTQNLTYVDTPAAILFGLDYKIAIGGTCFSAKTNTISINEEESLNEVVVSPVPFNDYINIQLPSDLDSEKISTRLINLSGKEITNVEIVKETNRLTMSNLKDLPSGVYVLHLTAGNKAKSFKLIH